MITLGWSAVRAGFFDRARILAAISRAEHQVLSRFGAFVRQRARSSIRARKAVSAPGQPPSSHIGTLKQLIFFSYDTASHSVVIGPTQSRPDSKVPQLLEYGGTINRARPLYYRARPFMQPAFLAELPRATALWRNSVHA